MIRGPRERRSRWRKRGRFAALKPELFASRRLKHLAARLKLGEDGLDDPEASRTLLELARASEPTQPQAA